MGPPPAPPCPSGIDAAPTHFVLVVGPATLRLANGTALPQLAYNGSIVGPILRARLGSEVSIDVVNALDVGTSIHWHGFDQPGTAWADGVSGLTQPPVPPGKTFRYRFRAEPAGTHWYHSHTGLQYADGLRGAFIVTDGDPVADDARDVVLLLADQADRPADAVLAELQDGAMSMGESASSDDGSMAKGSSGGGAMSGMAGGGAATAGTAGGGTLMGDAPGGGTSMAGMTAGKANAPATMDMGDGMKAGAPAPAPVAAAASAAAGGSRRRRLEQHSGHNGAAAGGHGGGAAVQSPPAAALPGPATASPAPAAASHGATTGGLSPPAAAVPPDPRTGCVHQTTQDLSDAPYYATLVNGRGYSVAPNGTAFGTPHVVTVAPGSTTRLRVINGAASWSYNFSVDGHALTLVALDGYELAPMRVNGLVLTPGETADVLLTADQPVGNYWIRVLTLSGYGSPAVLSYGGAPDPASDPALGRPPVVTGCAARTTPGTLDLKNATGLVGLASTPKPPAAANHTVAMYMTLNAADPQPPPMLNITGYDRPKPPPGCPRAGGKASRYCWGLNWVVFREPEVLPIYGLAFDDRGLAASLAAGADGAPTNSTSAVADYAIPVAAGETVDFVFINPGAMVHPMHVHGMSGWLLAAGNGRPPLLADGRVDGTRVNLANPVLRNTVPVANAVPGLGDGYAVFRVKASNPGPFAIHCHIEYHVAAGMMAYLAVRDAAQGPRGWPPPPPGLDCGGVARSGSPAAGSAAPEFTPFAARA